MGSGDCRAAELDVPADGMDRPDRRRPGAQRGFGQHECRQFHCLLRLGFGDDDQRPARYRQRRLRATTPTLPSPIAGTNYQLVFDDEFNGTSINPADWNQVGPWGLPDASHWYGHFTYPSLSGNMSKVSEANGNATITLQNAGGGPLGTWTGGVLSTDTTKLFQYGFFEVRAKLPAAGQGFWPAIWLIGPNGGAQEIDIMEWRGNNITSFTQTVHYADGSQTQAAPTSSDWTQAYHLFQLRWEPGRLTFYVDNVQTATWTANIPSAPMELLLNFDIGPGAGTNPPAYVYPNSSTPTTAAFNIDYARVYQQS